MPFSNRFTVPSNHFEIEDIATDTGLWAVRVSYIIRPSRKHVELAQCSLRARKSGNIQYDQGSGDSRDRCSTETKDHQQAVTFACHRLKVVAEAAVQQRQLDVAMREMKGELNPLQLFRIYRDRLLKDGRSSSTIENYRRAAHCVIALYGPNFTPGQITDVDEFCEDFIAARMNGEIELADDSGFKIRNLGETLFNTAAKDFARYELMIRYASRKSNPFNPDVTLQHRNPFDDPEFKVPTQEQGVRTEPLGFDVLEYLLNGYTEDDPAPVDMVDNDGSTRLALLMLSFAGMRRETVLIRQRKHFAFEPAEIRQMLRFYGKEWLRNSDFHAFKDRVWVLHDDTKMSKLSKENEKHYTRPVPLHPVVAAYVRSYFARNELFDADPEAYVISVQPDRSGPLSGSAFNDAPALKWVMEGGEVKRDEHLHPYPIIGDDSLPLIDSESRRDHKLGRWDRMVRILRQQILNAGDDWQDILPFRYRQAVKGFRTNLEQHYAETGWFRKHETEAAQESNTARHIDYLLNRRMNSNVRSKNYLWLEPELLLGAVDLLKAEEACRMKESRKAKDVSGATERIAESMGLKVV